MKVWFLHGNLGTPADFDAIRARLETVATEAIDLYAELAEAALSLEEWAEQFTARVAAEGNTRNVLVGYSMGGRLALHAALLRPELWDKVVIVSAHPGLQSEEEKFRRCVADAEWGALAITSDWRDFLRKWDAQPVLDGDNQPIAEDDARLKLADQRQAIARAFTCWSLGLQQDLRGPLSKLELPMLWLTGANDEKFTKLADELEGIVCQRRTFEGVGHRVLGSGGNDSGSAEASNYLIEEINSTWREQ